MSKLRFLFFTSLVALTLAGCTSQTPATQPPTRPPLEQPTKTLGGVVITFSGVSSDTLKASAQRVSSAGLSSQFFESAPSIVHTPLSQSSFTAGGFRYLSATFRVTPSSSLNNLSYVAQVKAGSTLSNTAVLDMKQLDGSAVPNANALALAVKPVQDLRRSSGALLVNQESADMQVWRESEVSAYPVSVGSYLLPYGFVARAENGGGRTLSSTLPGVVTFAVKLPLQASPKDDPFTFSMYFEAVTDTETRVTQSLEEQDGGVGAASRAAQTGANAVVNRLPGIRYTQSAPSRTICNVRTAGPFDNVLERLFPTSLELIFKTPAPNRESIPSSSAFNLGFSAPPSSVNSGNVQLRSPWRGLLSASYNTAGSSVTVSPSNGLLPGEVVEVNATTGLNLCQPNSFRVRGVSAVGKAIFDQDVGLPINIDIGLALASGDFTSDGQLDLLAFGFSGQARLFVGNGAGGFVGGAAFSGTGDARDVTTGDFNNDGKLDFAVNSPGPRVFLGDGAGNFSAQTPADLLYNSVSGIVSGDFNGDGKLDLAVSTLTNSSTSSGITVFMGVGNGTFLTGTAYLQSAKLASFANTALVSGDFNGDGLLDLAYGNDVSLSSFVPQVSVMLGQGGGTFGAFQSYPTLHDVVSMVSGDFNGDGRLDLIAAGRGTPASTLLLGNSAGSFGAGIPIPSIVFFLPGQMRTGNFNGDGKLDFAVPTASNISAVVVLLGRGDGSFDSGTYHGETAGPANGLATGDFNGDGKLDLALNTTPSQNVTPQVPSSVFALLNSSFGNALDFGNGSSTVSVSSITPLTNATDQSYSVSAWVKVPSSLPSSGDQLFRILTKNPNVPANNSPIPFSIFIQNGNVGVALCANTSGCTPFVLLSSKLVNDGGWHHIAFVRNAASTNNRKDLLYVDGLSETAVGNDTITTSLSSNQPLRMGASSFDSGFGGQLDEVKIWNNVHNVNEILADASPLRAPYSPNLVAYFKLDRVNGGVTPDERGGSNGILTSFSAGNILVERP